MAPVHSLVYLVEWGIGLANLVLELVSWSLFVGLKSKFERL